MRAAAVLVLTLLFTAARAQELPAVPDSAQVKIGYWMQERAQPRLGGALLPLAFGTLLSSVFFLSDERNANDLAPAAFATGLSFGIIGFSIELKASKRKRFIPYRR